jgi:hypothetical protein
MLHMLLWLYPHVPSICFKLMLQVVYLDLEKVDLYVVYIAMPIHVYFNRIFQVSHLFQMYIANVSSGC